MKLWNLVLSMIVVLGAVNCLAAASPNYLLIQPSNDQSFTVSMCAVSEAASQVSCRQINRLTASQLDQVKNLISQVIQKQNAETALIVSGGAVAGVVIGVAGGLFVGPALAASTVTGLLGGGMTGAGNAIALGLIGGALSGGAIGGTLSGLGAHGISSAIFRTHTGYVEIEREFDSLKESGAPLVIRGSNKAFFAFQTLIAQVEN